MLPGVNEVIHTGLLQLAPEACKSEWQAHVAGGAAPGVKEPTVEWEGDQPRPALGGSGDGDLCAQELRMLPRFCHGDHAEIWNAVGSSPSLE